MIKIVEVGSIEELDTYKRQWNALLQNNDTNVVFLTYEYSRSWWETYGRGRELLVLLAKKDSELVGIAPLTVTTHRSFGLKSRTVEFFGSLRSDYSDFIIGSDKEIILDAFYKYLSSIADRWDAISLSQIPESSSTIELSESLLRTSGMPFSVGNGVSCSVILLEGRGQEVLRQGFLRHATLRKHMNRLRRLGEPKYGHAADVEEGLSYLDVLFQQHINRWDNTLTPSVFYNEQPRKFYRLLVKFLLPAGWMRLAYLDLNGHPIATFLGFEYNGSMSQHSASFDTMYSRYSPSWVTNYYAVQYCLEHKLRDFDLLRGMEHYKSDMTNAIRHTGVIRMYKSPLQKFLHELKYAARKSRLFSALFGASWVSKLQMKLRKYRGRLGTLGLVKNVIHRLTCRIIDFSSNQLFEWNHYPIPELAVKCPLEVRVGSDADLNLIASFHGYTEKSPQVAKLKERLEKGDKPYLAFSSRTLAHVTWLCRRKEVEMREIWGALAFRDNEAYIMDCKTGFLFRGKDIYPAVLRHILKDLAAENVSKVYIACRTSNTSSFRGIEKAGFSPVRKIRAFRLFGKKIGAKTIQAG